MFSACLGVVRAAQQCDTRGCAGECGHGRGVLASVEDRSMACAKMLTAGMLRNKSIDLTLQSAKR